MSACTNCNAKLTCGCQRRTASNGAQVCSNCLASYEAKLRKSKPQPVRTIPRQQSTAPTNVTVLYRPPGVSIQSV